MRGRDPNNATWYLLRYAADFAARSATLLYDDARHVLELLPGSGRAAEPPPGVAVDVNGEVHRVDPRTNALLRRRCDGSEVPLVCEPQVFSEPAGLALDRRGLLHVADPGRRRVVVVRPDDGVVVATYGEGLLVRPIDVAASPDGRVYVADQLIGWVLTFDARFAPVSAFPARNGAGLPATPAPIALAVEADGAVLVADASHPLLLRFAPDGRPLADVPLATLVAELAGGDVALDALEKAYGRTLPRFLVGACGAPERDGGARLAAVHRAVRLLALRLGQTYAAEGAFLSHVLDGGTPGTVWHRLLLDADFPPGTQAIVETATAERPEQLPGQVGGAWPEGDPPVTLSASVPELLIQSRPGRYLRFRLTLRSAGDATPSVRAVKVLYPRVSYLDLLPRVFRRDPAGASFLDRFLALFERVFTGVEDRYEWFSRALNLDSAPPEVADWLGCLIDLTFDPSWPVERRRALLGEAMGLYRRRGTVAGLARYVEIYAGVRPVIVERFLSRPARPALLGSPGCVLGASFALTPAFADGSPDADQYAAYAHRFTVLVPLADRCDADVLLPVVRRIVAVNRPAHTEATVEAVYPEARVGLQSTVGVDFILGAAEAPRAAVPGGVLGVDTVLGERRPHYARPYVTQL